MRAQADGRQNDVTFFNEFVKLEGVEFMVGRLQESPATEQGLILSIVGACLKYESGRRHLVRDPDLVKRILAVLYLDTKYEKNFPKVLDLLTQIVDRLEEGYDLVNRAEKRLAREHDSDRFGRIVALLDVERYKNMIVNKSALQFILKLMEVEKPPAKQKKFFLRLEANRIKKIVPVRRGGVHRR